MDHQVGRVINAANSLGLLKDIVIVFAADNGWHLGEHKLWSKTSQFEESTHVPLMIYADGLTKGDKTSSLSELLDIYPTLCDLCNIEKPHHLDGKSLVGILNDKNAVVNDAVFSTLADAYTVITSDYRLTYYKDITPEGDDTHLSNKYKYELFDLTKDPNENINVYGDHLYEQTAIYLKKLLSTKYRIES